MPLRKQKMWGGSAVRATTALLVLGMVGFGGFHLEGGRDELVTVHSASYYRGLARADQWQAGPRVGLSSGSLARTQSLTEVGGGLDDSHGHISESLVKVLCALPLDTSVHHTPGGCK